MLVLEELEENADPMKRSEKKRKEWAEHWQCDSEVQCVEERGFEKCRRRTATAE